MGLIARMTRGLKRRTDGKRVAAPAGTPGPAQPQTGVHRGEAPRHAGPEPKPSPIVTPQTMASDQAAALRRVSAEPTTRRQGTATASVETVAEAPGARVTAHSNSPAPDQSGDENAALRRVPELGAETESKVIVPSNKKELFEELQKNYREVVTLVRKVDGHLDEHAARAERLLVIAKRFDEALPLLERMAETPAKLDTLREQLVALTTHASEQNELSAKNIDRVETAVSKVIEGVNAQHKDQHRLVAVMAEFRQTLGDLNETNTASTSAVQTLGEGIAKRDEAMLRHMATTQTRMTIGLVVIGVIGFTAIVLALAV